MAEACPSTPIRCRRIARAVRLGIAWLAIAWLAGPSWPAMARDTSSAQMAEAPASPLGRHPPAVPPLDVELSADDRAYLASLPPLRIAYDPAWAPLSFLDDRGQLAGLTADYLAYFENALHVRFELLPSASWQEAMRLADSGQADIVAAAEPGSAFAVPYTFTTAYVVYPTVVVTREDAPSITDMDDLAGRRLAITRGEDFGGYFSAIVHRFQLVPVENDREGLRAVARGDAFATVGNLGVLDPLIRKHYAGVLRIAMPTGHQQSLHFAVAARHHRLAALMDRVIAAIPPAERERIQNTWISTRVQYGISKRTLWHVLGPIAALVLLFIVALGFALQYVRAEVKQRRRSERELRYQLRFQRTLMDTIPVPVFLKDLQGRYLSVNPAYEDMMGLKHDEVVGKTLLETRHVDASAALHGITEATIGTGEAVHGHAKFRTASGEYRDAIYWQRMCYSDDGEPRAVLGVIADVTQLREVEQRELTLKRRLEELTEVLPVLTFQLAVSPGHVLKPLFVSKYAGTLAGVSADVLAERPERFFGLLAPATRRELARAYLRLSRAAGGSASAYQTDFRLDHEDGAKWIHLEFVVRRTDGGEAVVSGYLIDVTPSRMQTERLAQANAEAAEASRVKDAFLATMSHEIRTPMSGVIGVLDLMHRQHMQPDDQHLLDMARGAASSLMRILNDILDFSRHQDGELRLEMAAIDLREVIDDVAGLFAPEAQRKGLRFDVIVDSRIALRHRGDGHRIGQMLTNIVSNAMKFTEAGSISLRVDDGGTQGASQRLTFTVKDSGIGISPEQQSRLFHPFSQADTSTSRRYGGTGLGLAICRQLAESMGGEIRLDSALGKGTEIAISLPLEVVRAPSPAAGRREAWLSVDDPIVHEAIRHYLAALDVAIRAAPELKAPNAEPVLIFRDTELAMLDVERAMVVVNLTRSHVPGAVKAPDGALAMGTSPVLWRDVARACAMLDQDALDRQAAREVAQAAAVVAPPCPVTTLLVEDQPLNQELLLRQMASVGVTQCDLAGNGAEALRLMEEKRYQLIITDCAMPVMGGEELIRRIRQREEEQPSLGRAKVVALTANATSQQRQRCLDAGADEVFTKPVNRQRLAALLEGILPGESMPASAPASSDAHLLAELRDTLRRDARALSAALERHDRGDATSAAHRMLGCARWFGLDDVAEAAQVLEDALENGQDDTSQEVARLRRALQAFTADGQV
jgi:PAS domain S-box-containing protein